MTSFDLKRYAASHLRYHCQARIVALECHSGLGARSDELADVIAVDNHGFVTEVEVKISLADLRADRSKPKHEAYRKMLGMPYKKTTYSYFGQTRIIEPPPYPSHLFYFGVPQEIGKDVALVCDQLYPYAGVIGFPGGYSYRRARALSNGKITLLQAAHLAAGQSATICRLLDKISALEQRANR